MYVMMSKRECKIGESSRQTERAASSCKK